MGSSLQPPCLLVPPYALADAVGERPLGVVAEVAAGGCDVAVPVALGEDMVFVHIEGGEAAEALADGAVDGADGSEEP